jgi:hypothetical protein
MLLHNIVDVGRIDGHIQKRGKQKGLDFLYNPLSWQLTQSWGRDSLPGELTQSSEKNINSFSQSKCLLKTPPPNIAPVVTKFPHEF